MVVINKKRIQIVFTCITVGVFAFSFQIAKNKGEVSEIAENTVQTSATPVSGRTIVLDAGHGVPDERGTEQHRYNRSGN